MKRQPTVLFSAILILTALFVVSDLYAGDSALLSSTGKDVPRYAARVGEELALKELSGLTGGTVLTREDLVSRLQEAGADPSILNNCTDNACAAEIAQTLGLDALILFGIDSRAAGYDISLSGLLADGSTLGPVEDQVFDIRDIDDTIAALGTSLAIEAGLIEAPAEAVAQAADTGPGAEKNPEQQKTEASDNASGEEKSAETGDTGEEQKPDTESGDAKAESGDDDTAAQDTESIKSGDEAEKTAGESAEKAAEKEEDTTPAPGYDTGMLLFTSGIGAMQLGNLFSLTGFYLDAMAAGNYYKYTQASSQSDIDDFYGTYETELLLSKIFRVAGFSSMGAGLGTAGIPIFSSDALKLSRKGKFRFYSALTAYTAGNMLYLNSLDSFAEFSYNSAKGENNDYYADRALGDIPWVVLRGGGIAALWGTGTWWMVTAPDMPGKISTGPANFWDRVLVGSGLLFFGGGNFFAAMAGIDRSYALYDWYDYIEGSGNVGESYSSYADYMDSAELMGTLAVASWLTSAACFAAAELFNFPDPFGGSSGAALADALRFSPLPGGGAFYVHLEFQ